AADVGDVTVGVAAVQRVERELQAVAEAGVNREILPHPPLVLQVQVGLAQAASLNADSLVHILAGRLIEACVAADLRDAAGEECIKVLRRRQVGGGGAGEIRGTEHGQGGI